MGVLLHALVRMGLYQWGATISMVNMGKYHTAAESDIVSTRLETGLRRNTPNNPVQRRVKPRRFQRNETNKLPGMQPSPSLQSIGVLNMLTRVALGVR